LLQPIYRTLEVWGSLPLSKILFCISSLEVSYVLVEAVTSMGVKILCGFQWKELILDRIVFSVLLLEPVLNLIDLFSYCSCLKI
jgi:hypothetical protein